jgi:hypothetical protein
MRHRIRKALSPRNRGPWILASALAVALLVAPFAGAFGEGNAVKGGARNPSPDARRAYTKETQIIANVITYGTRQSNKSNNGGGAVYGCRSGPGGTAKGNEPCIRANNLSTGLAFEFNSTDKAATQVGSITATNTNAAPFTTNATGVATGLNADKVDGQNASDLQAKFATVNGADGAVGSNRGVAASGSGRASAGVYNVVFDSDVSKCSRTATIAGGTPGLITTDAGANAQTITVRTFDTAATPAATDHSFNLTVTC